MEKEKREELEKRICTRIGRLIAIINCLIVSKIPTVSCNCLYIFLKKAFDILTAVTKYYINLLNLKPKMNMPEPISLPEVFYNLVDICSDTVLKNLFTFLNYSEPPENRVDLDNKKSKRNENSNTKRLKLMKNRKLITNLIFSVENMERYSIDLNRKLPGDVQVLKYLKLIFNAIFIIFNNAFCFTENGVLLQSSTRKRLQNLNWRWLIVKKF